MRDALRLGTNRSSRALTTLAVVAGIVGGATMGIAPVLILAIAWCAPLVIGRVLTMEQAYAAIDWKVIFLLAGVFPLAIAGAIQMGADPRPLLVAVTFSASASFLTPVGYPTNAMVPGPGEYKFSDFARVGILLNAILLVLAVVLIPRFVPF